jgi:hypothetical protein
VQSRVAGHPPGVVVVVAVKAAAAAAVETVGLIHCPQAVLDAAVDVDEEHEEPRKFACA